MHALDETAAEADDTAADLAAPGFVAELETLAQALEKALAAGDLELFYRVFRQGELPFLPLALHDDPLALYRRATDVVWRLGGISPAVALAVENHYSVLCPIATLPTAHDPRLDGRRRELLATIESRRWLVANTNSRIHDNQIAKTGTVIRRREAGFVVDGEAVYLSLASEGDVLVFISFFETGEPVLFACPLKGNPAIEIGPLLFPDAMRDSDTRRVTFRHLELDESHVLVSGQEQADIVAILTYELIWHQVLLASLALGTAARALEEGRVFLRAAKRPDGTPLAELDGMVVDMGRQLLRYHAGRGSLDLAGRALARLAAQPFTPAAVSATFELACAAKYFCTGFAEDVVGVVRRIIGARSFAGGHGMERLSKEVVFGALGGEVNAIVERRLGTRALGENQLFLGPRPAASVL